MIWCDFERASFPDDEFYEDPQLGLVHKKSPLHTTKGDVVEDRAESACGETADAEGRVDVEEGEPDPWI
jgi:hypothetical protein